MSSDLTWLLVRNWNSFQVKGGHGPVFSKEKVSRDFGSGSVGRGRFQWKEFRGIGKTV